MADQVVSALNALFLGDAAQYAGAFQREMMVRFGSAPAGLMAHVAGTPKYAAFVNERALVLAARFAHGDDLASVGRQVVAKAATLAGMGTAMDADALEAAVQATPEYEHHQKGLILEVAAMCDRELGDSQIAALMTVHGVDDLRDAIEAMGSESEYEYETDASSGKGDEDEADDDGAECDAVVDAAFMDEFNVVYGRDPTVYEYVYVRHLMATAYLTLKAISELHFAAYTDLEIVHRELLDETLTEAQFCKRYLPAALTDADLPARQREAVLASASYRSSMRDRLSALHKTRFGEDVTQDEGDYMFERSVLKQRLALQSDKLNEIVDAFAEQTTRLYETVTDLYKGVLGREPEDVEVRAVLMAFRLDESAASAELRRDLVRSLEYREVLRAEIVRVRPDMSVPAVFRTLDVVLRTSRLEDYSAETAVKMALAK